MQSYDHQQLEKKWQDYWEENSLYRTVEDLNQPKFYILDMFPYPSGAGLHVGHPKGYIATDIYARKQRMMGKSVLHPMGWDAFGLPAENHALKTGESPAVATSKNITTFKKQLRMLGLGYDWDREINTTDPEFYHWTQWCFLQFWDSYYDEKLNQARPISDYIATEFGPGVDYYDLDEVKRQQVDDQRLAFESEAPINWCPGCQTGLANEDLENGVCERCGSNVERRPMRQWVLRITKYADRLLKDLELLPAWEDFIKTMQVNWIGRSEGAEVDFKIVLNKDENGAQPGGEYEEIEQLTVFTTRIDTLYGCTYVVVAPEHQLIQQILAGAVVIDNQPAVTEYIEQVKRKSELERTDLNKDKTGVPLEGIEAINPVNGESVPVWVADYVLGDYGTGAVMAVPAHDERDFEFASKYGLSIKEVIVAAKTENQAQSIVDKAYTEYGHLIDSAEFSGLQSEVAKQQITAKLTAENLARRRVNYKIKDWVFSRQRYWGEPIPMIHCSHCGVVPVPAEQLPVKLPDVEHYQPTGTGESPLVNITDWIEVDCPRCGQKAKREANTMPQWAGSSWYYLRYADPHNNQALIDPAKEKYWQPVDFYVGGAEHATRHLIYARFWHKFLYDLQVVSHVEPFTKLQHVGLIMAEDGRKMSKRWNNVINPDVVVEQYGADAMRVYEMFMAPFDQAAAWNMQGVGGVRKFLEKVWQLQTKVQPQVEPVIRQAYQPILEKTIAKVSNDIDDFKFNTAVSAMMILVNDWQASSAIALVDWERFCQILSPFAPHLAEELWRISGHQESILLTDWPVADEELLAAQDVKIMLQVNGKLRGELSISAEVVDQEAEIKAVAREKLIELGKLAATDQVIKEIYVPGKIVNLVIK